MGTTSDYFVKVGSPGTATTMSAPGHSIGGAAISVGSTANWPGVGETVIFAIDTVTIQTINGVATEVRNANSYTEWQALVTSSTGIGSMVLRYGTDQNYPSGSTTRVYIPVASSRENRLVDGITTSLNQDGTLKTSAVQTALGLSASVGAGWTPLANTFTYGANNGNKEFTVTTPSDLTGVLSSGMRFQLTRGTTAPTQAMSFTAASSQYATKASPTGITFTAAYTCEAWVYLNSYTGSSQVIVGRLDNAATTGGWRMLINPSGQIDTDYGTGSTFTVTNTYQSIPLRKWTHIAVTATVATKAVSIYINGESVPVSQTGSTTTMVQPAVDLRIGAASATPANTYFDGYMSEVRVWSVAQTQASIQANMGLSLTGSETNIVALHQGNGTFADKTASANTLTASGGAIATQAANPYNNIEYANVVSVAYSAPNTTVTLNTGDYGTVPSMTLSSPQYSTQNMPFGFPKILERTTFGYTQIMTNFSTSSASMAEVSGLRKTVTVPTGGQRLRITAFVGDLSNSSTFYANMGIFDGIIGSGGIQIAFSRNWSSTATRGLGATCSAVVNVPAGSRTFSLGAQAEGGGTVTAAAATINPAYLSIEPV